MYICVGLKLLDGRGLLGQVRLLQLQKGVASTATMVIHMILALLTALMAAH